MSFTWESLLVIFRAENMSLLVKQLLDLELEQAAITLRQVGERTRW